MKLITLFTLFCSISFLHGEEDYFGANKEATGLVGYLYNLKHDSEGNPSAALGGHANSRNYYKLLEELLDKGLKDQDLEKYQIADTSCNFEYMAFKHRDAESAPTAFGSAYIQPKAILMVYSGVIEEAPEEELRFAGYFDDALMVLVNGEVVFYNAIEKFNKFKPDVPASSPGSHDAYGKYITLKKGDKLKIAFAEVPGGSIGGTLRVQLRKFRYRENHNDEPVLHPFVAKKVNRALEKEMQNRGIPFEDRRIPRFIFTKK